MLSEFKKFILRGNVVDLAVAVAVGAAFNNVVQALVSSLITPLVGIFYTQDKFAEAAFTVSGSEFMYGRFVNAVISFLIVAAVIFFLIVQPINHLQAVAAKSKKTEDPTTKKCPECLSEVPINARRCAHCTSVQTDANAKPATKATTKKK